MSDNKLHLQIITPNGKNISEKADMIIMRSINGDIGIMPNHEPLSIILGDGILRIIENKDERRIAVFGGIAKIADNKISIISDYAKRPEDIDIKLAEKERENALKLLKDKSDDLKIKSNQILLRRALVQIEVSSSNLIQAEEDDED